jgi:2-oxoglutarate ferredoxin oxidoreductase subunit alpha
LKKTTNKNYVKIEQKEGKIKKFIMGNEAIVEAALVAGAEALFGYPITPTTEVLQFWAEKKAKNKKLIFMQAEDEMAAGFATIGACLAGKKAFDVTAGPGNVLAQDPFSMAEAMRIPIVVIIGQRGGPSTGTVIYSQQEVLLTSHGGNGEGFRIVFSPTNLQELYDFTIEAFNTAWTYFFPTFVLTDGYLCKEKSIVDLHKAQKVVKPKPIFEKGKVLNLRNCYDMEEEIYEKVEEISKEFNKIASRVVRFEEYKLADAKYIIFAHGSVAASCRVAVDILRQKKIKAGLFIPKTLSPFPENQIKKALLGKKKIFVVESSLGQFSMLVQSVIYGSSLPFFEYLKPALGIMPEEIVNFVKEHK